MSVPNAKELLERALAVEADDSVPDDLGEVMSECFARIIFATKGQASPRDIGVAIGATLTISRIYLDDPNYGKEMDAGLQEGTKMALRACMQEEGGVF